MIPRFVPPVSFARVLAAVPPSVGGSDVAAFEAAFAEAMGQRYAVAFPYGRTALLALLACLALRDREILLPAYTCVVVPNAVVHSGNVPVFIDSGLDANARLGDVPALVNGRTGALIATSIFGNPVDLDALDDLRSRHPNLPVIQDCAHSFICEWRGRPVHREGVAAVFGLNVSKTMTSVFGGMATTDDDRLAAALRAQRELMLRPPDLRKTLARMLYALAVVPAFWPPFFTITSALRRMGALDRFTRYYDEARIDMPVDHLTGMTAFEARVGRAQAARLPTFIAVRRAYDAYYRAALADRPGLAWVERPEGSSVSHVAARVADRTAVVAAAARLGVELGEVIEYCIPEFEAYRQFVGDASAYPVAGTFARSTVNLPTSTVFDERLASRVVSTLDRVLNGAPPAPPLPIRAEAMS